MAVVLFIVYRKIGKSITPYLNVPCKWRFMNKGSLLLDTQSCFSGGGLFGIVEL